MEPYEKLELEIVLFDSTDVITDSKADVTTPGLND